MINLPNIDKCTVAVIGLGYVGLPLAIEFAKEQHNIKSKKLSKRKIIAFDINKDRIAELIQGYDRTKQLSKDDLNLEINITYTSNEDLLSKSDVFIITVPTPIDKFKNPDLEPLKSASLTVAKALKKRNNYYLMKNQNQFLSPLVIYESTVYPGATEEVCIPLLENISKLKLNKHFFCGYSPERVNPGDKANTLINISKLTSGSNELSSEWIDNFYGSIIKAGTFKTRNIKTAEAAKIIENTQRDLNIALVNELAIIFSKLGLDTLEVLQAASTKWNFLHFKPGLVGGHCIGVDPYYLTYKAEEIGYRPEVVLAGRRINDGMSKWIVDQVILKLAQKGFLKKGLEVLVMGASFKENCNDLRNTKVKDVIEYLKTYALVPFIFDPVVSKNQIKDIFEIDSLREISNTKKPFRVIFVLVAHDYFKKMDIKDWKSIMTEDSVIFDLKGIVPFELNPIRI